jgi:hypothetical protein
MLASPTPPPTDPPTEMPTVGAGRRASSVGRRLRSWRIVFGRRLRSIVFGRRLRSIVFGGAGIRAEGEIMDQRLG